MGPETSGPIWRMSLAHVRGLDDDFGGDEVEEFQSIEEGASRGDFLPSEGTSSDATQAPGVDVSDIAALLTHIQATAPYQILDFGCGPGRDAEPDQRSETAARRRRVRFCHGHYARLFPELLPFISPVQSNSK